MWPAAGSLIDHVVDLSLPVSLGDVEGGVETDVQVDRGRARRHAYHLMMLS